MRPIPIISAVVLCSAISAAQQTTVAHAPFQGTYSYGFESASAIQTQTCLATDVGQLCSSSGVPFIVSYNLITPYCTKYPHSGNKMAVALGMPPSMTLEFPEPMQRFGMWYAHSGQYMSFVEVYFFDANDNVIDIQEAELPPCPWTWIGWQALEGDGFSKVEMVHYGDDCAAFAMDDITAEPIGTGNGLDLGHDICTAEPNSTGRIGRMSVQGSNLASCSALLLRAQDLPPRVPATFLMSSQLSTSAFPGSGLCLGNPLVHVPASVLVTDPTGKMSAMIETQLLPILAGQTWGFQAWHREPGATDGFTNTVVVTFQ